MAADTFLALLVYAFVTSITPGPNNLMLLASGVNFGFVRTIPHALGIGGGFLTLLLAVGFGLGAVLAAFPALHIALKVAGGAYLVYLAWRIAMSRSMGSGNTSRARPMTFLEAAAFQWVNPKAWMMVVGAVAAFAPAQDYYHHVARIALVMAVVGLPTIALWAGAGTLLRGLLQNPHAMRSFNIVMALLLVASLYPALNG